MQKHKKILSLTLALALAFMPATIFAEGVTTLSAMEIADIGQLQEAIDGASGALEIKLTSHIDGNVIIPDVEYNFTIDLNGKKLTAINSGNAISHKGTGTVTIIDSVGGGTVDAASEEGCSAISNDANGIVKVAGGEISATGEGGSAVYNGSNGEVNISGGAVRATDGAYATIYNISGTVNITGGEVLAEGPSGSAIYNAGAGTVRIKGGAASATGKGGTVIHNYSQGQISIEGGTVSATDGAADAIYNNNGGTVNITGGIVSATGNAYTTINNHAGTVTIAEAAVLIPEGELYPVTESVPTANIRSAVLKDGQAIYTLSGLQNPIPSNWLVYTTESGDALAKNVVGTLKGSTLTLSGDGLTGGDYYLAAYDRANGKGAGKRIGLTVRKPHIVTFDVDGGDGGNFTVTVVSGDKVTAPTSIPTKEGCHFRGWYLGKEEFDFANAVVTQDLVLTAKMDAHIPGDAATVEQPQVCVVCGKELAPRLSYQDVIVHDKSNVTVEYEDDGVFDPEIVLSVIMESQDKMDEYKDNIDKVAPGLTLGGLYDVKLLRDGMAIQPGGKVKVTIPLTEAMKAMTELQIIYIDPNGNVTIIPSQMVDGKIVFVTDHFSYYGVIGKIKPVKVGNANYIENPSGVISPRTGDESHRLLLFITLLVAGGIITILFVKNRKAHNKI